MYRLQCRFNGLGAKAKHGLLTNNEQRCREDLLGRKFSHGLRIINYIAFHKWNIARTQPITDTTAVGATRLCEENDLGMIHLWLAFAGTTLLLRLSLHLPLGWKVKPLVFFGRDCRADLACMAGVRLADRIRALSEPDETLS